MNTYEVTARYEVSIRSLASRTVKVQAVNREEARNHAIAMIRANDEDEIIVGPIVASAKQVSEGT